MARDTHPGMPAQGSATWRQFLVTLQTEGFVTYLVEAQSAEDAAKRWGEGELHDIGDFPPDDASEVIEVEEVTPE